MTYLYRLATITAVFIIFNCIYFIQYGISNAVFAITIWGGASILLIQQLSKRGLVNDNVIWFPIIITICIKLIFSWTNFNQYLDLNSSFKNVLIFDNEITISQYNDMDNSGEGGSDYFFKSDVKYYSKDLSSNFKKSVSNGVIYKKGNEITYYPSDRNYSPISLKHSYLYSEEIASLLEYNSIRGETENVNKLLKIPHFLIYIILKDGLLILMNLVIISTYFRFRKK
jgi:hypothetical protein